MRRALWLLPVVLGAVVMLGPSLWGGADPVPYDIQHGFLPWSADPAAPTPAENGLLRDLVDTYDPEQRTIWERLRGQGDPGWLEGSGLGAPGWWFVGSGALSPFVAIDRGAGLPNGAGVAGVLRLLVAGAGAGLAARRWGASRWGAAVAAGAFAFSGFMLSWFGWPQAHVGAFVGWVWWAADRAAAPQAPAWSVPALSGVTALAWLGGFPAVTALLLVSAAPVVLVAAWAAEAGWRGRAPGIARGVVGLVAGTMLAAVTLLPSLAHLGAMDLSARAEAWRGAIPLSLLPRVALPDAFGDGAAVPYWGRLNLIEGSAYVGIPVLVLCALGLVLGWHRRGVRLAGGLLAGSAALAYGFPPLLQLLRVVPGLSTNPPARGVLLACAAAAVLGGLGVDALRERLPVARRGLVALGTAIAALVLVLAVAQPQQEVAELAALRLTTEEARTAARALLADEALRAVLLALGTVAVGVAVWRRAAGRLRTGLLALLVVVAVVDPWLQGQGWNAQRPRTEAYPPSVALQEVAAGLGPRARVAAPDGVLLPMTDLRGPVDDARGRRFVTADQRALVEAAGGRFASATRWALDPDPAAWTGALGALGVQVVLIPADAGSPDGWVREDLGEGIAAVAVPDASPWVSMATEVEAVPSAAVPSAVASRSGPGVVVVVDPGPRLPEAAGGEVEVVEVEGRTIRLRVDTTDGGLLRVLEPWLPGWTAAIDGVPAEVLQVDGGFVGVVLPPGDGVVTLAWHAPWLRAGAWTSGLTALGLAVALVVVGRRPSTLHSAEVEAYGGGSTEPDP